MLNLLKLLLGLFVMALVVLIFAYGIGDMLGA
jgi:hypothetical protein